MPDKPDKDQEHVEDYLELERYVELLQAEHAAPLPEDMTPEQAHIYRMANLFHAATHDAVTPDATFTAQLEARLLAQLHTPIQDTQGTQNTQDTQQDLPAAQGMNVPVDTRSALVTGAQTGEQISSSPTKPVLQKKVALSRRRLLAGAATVAASLGIGAGIEYTVEHTGVRTGTLTGTQAGSQTGSGTQQPVYTPLVGNVPTTWLRVTSLAELDTGAVRFATSTVVGYVVHVVKDNEYANEIIALSAACTHMGCIVQWQNADHRFHCPCHEGLFEASGEPANIANSPGHIRYLAPLPRLNTKIENGDVYVEVPV